MGMNRVLAALVLMAGAAQAETEVDAYGLGYHKPVPERWLKLDEDLSIRIRVLHKDGALAAEVTAGQVVQTEVTFFGREGAKDRDVQLVCSARFKDAEAVDSDFVRQDKPCYTGRLSDATGRFVPLDMDLYFRPVSTDPAGTSAVEVQVTDKVVNDHVTLWATYDWQGGRK
jgi:hypothetical protein